MAPLSLGTERHSDCGSFAPCGTPSFNSLSKSCMHRERPASRTALLRAPSKTYSNRASGKATRHGINIALHRRKKLPRLSSKGVSCGWNR